MRKETDGTLTDLASDDPDYHEGIVMMLNKINQE
jgi:hypothetical protein